MKVPSRLDWATGFARFLWKEGVLWLAVKTVYPFVTGNRKVVGTRRWLCNHRYLLTPWKQTYLRWRMHTVFKTDERELPPRRFWATLWEHREQYVAWLRWHRDMKARRAE